MKPFSQFVIEAFDKPYPYKFGKSGKGYSASAKLDDGSVLEVFFAESSPNEWELVFTRNGNLEKTGTGDAMRVFATVLSAVKDFIKAEPNLQELFFSASKIEWAKSKELDSREKLYDRMMKRFASQHGFDIEMKRYRAGTSYILIKKSK